MPAGCTFHEESSELVDVLHCNAPALLSETRGIPVAGSGWRLLVQLS